MTALHAFHSMRNPSATVLGLNAALIQMSPAFSVNQGASAYASSKMAQLKMLEHFAAENPDMFVASVHPGIVATGMADTAGASESGAPLDDGEILIFPVIFSPCHSSSYSFSDNPGGRSLPLFLCPLWKEGRHENTLTPKQRSAVKLPAHFLVWMASPEAAFLRAKFVWANWDVEQLKAKAGEIQGSQMLTSNVLGWPYTP